MSSSWYDERNSRTLEYAGRVLNPNRWIVVEADAAYARTYAGQVATLVAVGLLGRMTPSVTLRLSDAEVRGPLPWAGQSLCELLATTLTGADPNCRFEEYSGRRTDDYVLHIGPDAHGHIVHGTGWDLHAGPGPSTVQPGDVINPIGPALAAIAGVAQLFAGDLHVPSTPFCASAWSWGPPTAAGRLIPRELDLGAVWSVGVGSVGTAALYFLTLLTRQFTSELFDMDRVGTHNLDRSPIFSFADVGKNKVDAVADYLRRLGVLNVTPSAVALDEAPRWLQRSLDVPDILISAANERNVRHVVEDGLPPLQVYGTTGKNWQATVLRHVPTVDPCSLCIFPNHVARPTDCATGEVVRGAETMDAALPFLSYAAGAMTAAEILKLHLWDGPLPPNRAVFNVRPSPRFIPASLARRDGCRCQTRDANLHRKALASGRHSRLHERPGG